MSDTPDTPAGNELVESSAPADPDPLRDDAPPPPAEAEPASGGATETARKVMEKRMNIPFPPPINASPFDSFRLRGLAIRPVSAVRSIFQIDPPSITLDDLAARALAAVRDVEPFKGAIKKAENEVGKRGHSARVAAVSARLNQSGLDRTVRLLLSTPGVYHWLIHQALTVEKVKAEDTVGLAGSVMRKVHDDPKEAFHKALFDGVIQRRRLNIDKLLRTRVEEALAGIEVPLTPGQPEATILALIDRHAGKALIEDLVEKFAGREEIDPLRFTERVRASMVQFLKDLGLKVDPQLSTKNYDEYLALAFSHAIRTADEASADPLDAARNRGSTADWNFEVNTFDYVEEQGIVRENILAAGALDYIYVLGEVMGVYRLADAVVLRWAAGTVDVTQGETASKMYRYLKIRDDRHTEEERATLYRRVLNRGGGRLLSSMVPNESFPVLWGRLMTEVAKYIEKSEGNDREITFVSRTPVYQATKQLQYNLTEHMTGMAHLQTTEMYAHLQEAMEILGAPEIVDHYAAGTRKNVWAAIERASRQEFGSAPDLSLLRTLAVDGNRIFRWIASFDQGNVRDEQFRELLESAEAWILAQASEGAELEAPGGEEEFGENVGEDDWEI